MMRVIYAPRNDIREVRGGDVIYMMQVKRQLQQHGVDLQFAPVETLHSCARADLLHLTQIYQIDTAETARAWAERRHIPVVVNPLFEEVLAMWFRWAIRRQRKWQYLARALGVRLAESIYMRWQTARRRSDATWRRQRALLQGCCVVPNTEYELNHLQRWFDLPHLAGPVVPLGVDTELYGSWRESAAQPLPAGLERHRGKYILQVGLLSLRKNQVGLLQALDRTDHLIVFVGRPTPYEPEYKEEIECLAEARGNVLFVKHVLESLLPALYANASLHILPSWSERPGMVSIEAAASGCKVISSNRAPVHEYLGDLAWYVDPAKPEQICDTVQKALASATPPELRQRALGFGWHKTAQRLREVYSALLSGGISPG